MNKFLANKQIILGVTGGVAAYKSVDLIRRLREAGAEVRVVMTANAKKFITPLTMQAISGHPIHDELFDLAAEAAMGHIELARWADVILVAPASANFMARLLRGEADDLLTTLCAAAKAPIVVVPSMNQAMWKNTRNQHNVQDLKTKGIHFFGPTEGSQACGDVGPGRMMEPIDIVKNLQTIFQTGALSGKQVIITAGPTHEYIDPIRFLSNASSGKMGYALAEAAMEAGAIVTLISGPVHLAKPERVNLIPVVSAQDMLDQVMANIENCDIFLSVAAVADYRCKERALQKIAKTAKQLTLELEKNPDIVSQVAALSPRPFVIGFAAETEDLINKAKAKLKNKKLDMIIANSAANISSDQNEVSVIWKTGQQQFPLMSKAKLARELINLIGSIITHL